MKQVGYLVIIALAALYVLLGVQAEPITGTLAFVAAGLLTLSVTVAIVKGRQ